MFSKKRKEPDKPKELKRDRPNEVYTEPRPILASDCEFEKVDRGEGMGVDDIKTYHATEK